MATPDEEHKVAVKLLVHKEQNRVIFAEANNDFADILFGFLTLPLGTIIRIAGEEQSVSEPGLKVGSLTNLYRSVADLDSKFFCEETCKNAVVYPRNYAEPEFQRLKVNIDDAKTPEYFKCEECRGVSICKDCRCECGDVMSTSVSYCHSLRGVRPSFFRESATLIFCDDFSIIPSSPQFIMELFNRFGIKDVKLLTEKVVYAGKKEILNLLKCSLISKTPLTDAFIRSPHQTQYEPCTAIPPLIEHNTNNSQQQFTLKVLLRKSDKKILFAEGNDNFISQIFTILTIPLGLVVRLLGGSSTLGSVDQLYSSIMNQDIRRYLLQHELIDKTDLMLPKIVPHFCSNKHLLPLPTGNMMNMIVRSSRTMMSCYEVNPKLHDGSCVKWSSPFIVTDELVVKPASSLFSVAFLESLKIPEDIEEKVVSFGTDQAYRLLKSSLLSESALTEALMHG